MDSLLDNRYELGEPLGRGGMAQVVRAWDRRLGRDVAIKFLSPHHASDPRMLERFRQEIGTLAQFSHPNVVTIFDTGETDDGRHYLVMERLHGCTLDKILRDLRDRGEHLSPQRLVHFARQVCSALQAAHAQNIVHRDIKPANIFVLADEAHRGRDTVKLLDFGIAKAIDRAPEITGEPPLTEKGSFIGTAHYAAPEVIAPEEHGAPDTRADIFSLGVVLYECATGTRPFDGLPAIVVYGKTAHEQIPPPRSRLLIPRALDTIIRKATALSPADRYPSIRDLAAALGVFEATLVRSAGGVVYGGPGGWTPQNGWSPPAPSQSDRRRGHTPPPRPPTPPPPPPPPPPPDEVDEADSTTKVRSKPENALDSPTADRSLPHPVEALTTSDTGPPTAARTDASPRTISRAGIATTVASALLAVTVVATLIFMPEPTDPGPQVQIEKLTGDVRPPPPPPPPPVDDTTGARDHDTTTGAYEESSGGMETSVKIPELDTDEPRRCKKELTDLLYAGPTTTAIQSCLRDEDLAIDTPLTISAKSTEDGMPQISARLAPGAKFKLGRAHGCITKQLGASRLECRLSDVRVRRKFPDTP